MRQLQAALLTWRMTCVEADTLGALGAACGQRRKELCLGHAWRRWRPQAPSPNPNPNTNPNTNTNTQP